jgi:hypothetical protein
MMQQSKVRVPVLLLAAALLTATPAWSQEEAGEEVESDVRSLSIDVAGWFPQPAGLDYSAATIADPVVGVSNELWRTDFGTETANRLGVGFVLPGNMGTLRGFYEAVTFETQQQDYRPGSYIFGQSLSFRVPQGEIGAPGVNDDSFADGVLFSTATSLREWAISYERNAFRTQRVEGRWSIGWRGTRHRRNQDVNYYAILSPLPPLLPPGTDCFGTPEQVPDGTLLNCTLSPAPDSASLGSTYDGRGPMARIDVDVKLWRDKLILETGAAFTVQRGKLTADYLGTNNYYICTGDAVDPATGEGCTTGKIVTFPFSELSQVIELPGGDTQVVGDFVTQQSLSAGTRTQSQSATSDILDLFLGVRWKALDWLDVHAGLRSSRYSDVGLDLVPKDVSVAVSGALGIPTVETKKTSVTYEGFYAGLRFSFF